MCVDSLNFQALVILDIRDCCFHQGSINALCDDGVDDSIVELVLCIIILLPVRARILTVGVKLPGGTSW